MVFTVAHRVHDLDLVSPAAQTMLVGTAEACPQWEHPVSAEVRKSSVHSASLCSSCRAARPLVSLEAKTFAVKAASCFVGNVHLGLS